MRQKVAMVQLTESGERQSVAHNGALLAVFLYRPISRVTLADDQMVSRSTYQHDVHRSSNPMHSATQSRPFWLSPDPQ